MCVPNLVFTGNKMSGLESWAMFLALAAVILVALVVVVAVVSAAVLALLVLGKGMNQAIHRRLKLDKPIVVRQGRS
jgi:hypothetical protein